MGAFVENLREPGGQVEQVLTISQETPPLPEKKKKCKKEAFLARAENMGNIDPRFTTDSLTEEVKL